MKQTKPEHNGASQLIPGVGPTVVRFAKVASIRSLCPRVAVAVVLTIGGCHSESPPPPKQQTALSDVDDVRAALLLFGYRDTETIAANFPRRIACIQIEGSGEPATRLFTRLSGYGMNARSATRCVRRGDRWEDAIDAEPGILLRIDSLQLTEPGRAVGQISCLFGPKVGVVVRCELRFTGASWTVTQVLTRVEV